MGTDTLISTMADRIVAGFHPSRVVFLGSQARDTATDSSDVAERLLASDRPSPPHVCWLAQQTAKKALKDMLHNLLPVNWQTRTVYDSVTAEFKNRGV